MNMTHPDILKMNRCGYLYEPPEIRNLGECDNCGEDLTTDYAIFEDRYWNKFCCRDCAIQFHGIKEGKKPGRCDSCGENITTDYEIFDDRHGNKFCCMDCAIQFHEIEEI